MKLIETRGKGRGHGQHRYYQLDFTIKKTVTGHTIAEQFESLTLKPHFKMDEDPIKNGITKICISDAHTHAERLVFPAFFVTNTKTNKQLLTIDYAHIAGTLTFMTKGGDSSTLLTDQDYIDQLKEINKDVST